MSQITAISTLKSQGYKFAKVTNRQAGNFTVIRITTPKAVMHEVLAEAAAMQDFDNAELSQHESRGWFINAPAETEDL